MIGLQTATQGAFNVLWRVVDKQCLVGFQSLFLQNALETFFLGFTDMQDMREISRFEDGLKKVKAVFFFQMSGETVIIELIGVAEKI